MKDNGLSGEMRPDDPRQETWRRQREDRGFDDTELWSLTHSLARIILPRLRAFREYSRCCPCSTTEREWDEKLRRMIRAFELAESGDLWDEATLDEMQGGLDLFAEWYVALWS